MCADENPNPVSDEMRAAGAAVIECYSDSVTEGHLAELVYNEMERRRVAEEERQRRFEDLLKAGLKTPPSPLKDKPPVKSPKEKR